MSNPQKFRNRIMHSIPTAISVHPNSYGLVQFWAEGSSARVQPALTSSKKNRRPSMDKKEMVKANGSNPSSDNEDSKGTGPSTTSSVPRTTSNGPSTTSSQANLRSSSVSRDLDSVVRSDSVMKSNLVASKPNPRPSLSQPLSPMHSYDDISTVNDEQVSSQSAFNRDFFDRSYVPTTRFPGNVEVDGDFICRGRMMGTLTTAPTAADYAEQFLVEEDEREVVTSGSVVQLSFHNLRLTLKTTQPQSVFMIVSTNPSIAAGVDQKLIASNSGAMCAFVGVVPVRVKGVVKSGSNLIPSGLSDGCAISSSSPLVTSSHALFRTISVAMESTPLQATDSINCENKILCLLHPQAAMPQNMLPPLSPVASTDLIAPVVIKKKSALDPISLCPPQDALIKSELFLAYEKLMLKRPFFWPLLVLGGNVSVVLLFLPDENFYLNGNHDDISGINDTFWALIKDNKMLLINLSIWLFTTMCYAISWSKYDFLTACDYRRSRMELKEHTNRQSWTFFIFTTWFLAGSGLGCYSIYAFISEASPKGYGNSWVVAMVTYGINCVCCFVALLDSWYAYVTLLDLNIRLLKGENANHFFSSALPLWRNRATECKGIGIVAAFTKRPLCFFANLAATLFLFWHGVLFASLLPSLVTLASQKTLFVKGLVGDNGHVVPEEAEAYITEKESKEDDDEGNDSVKRIVSIERFGKKFNNSSTKSILTVALVLFVKQIIGEKAHDHDFYSHQYANLNDKYEGTELVRTLVSYLESSALRRLPFILFTSFLNVVFIWVVRDMLVLQRLKRTVKEGLDGSVYRYPTMDETMRALILLPLSVATLNSHTYDDHMKRANSNTENKWNEILDKFVDGVEKGEKWLEEEKEFQREIDLWEEEGGEEEYRRYTKRRKQFWLQLGVAAALMYAAFGMTQLVEAVVEAV